MDSLYEQYRRGEIHIAASHKNNNSSFSELDIPLILSDSMSFDSHKSIPKHFEKIYNVEKHKNGVRLHPKTGVPKSELAAAWGGVIKNIGFTYADVRKAPEEITFIPREKEQERTSIPDPYSKFKPKDYVDSDSPSFISMSKIMSEDEFERELKKCKCPPAHEQYGRGLYKNLKKVLDIRNRTVKLFSNILTKELNATEQDLLGVGNCLRMMESDYVTEDVSTPGGYLKYLENIGKDEVRIKSMVSLMKIVKNIAANKFGEETVRKAETIRLKEKGLDKYHPIYAMMVENLVERSIEVEWNRFGIEMFEEMATKTGLRKTAREFADVDEVMDEIKKFAKEEYYSTAKYAGVEDLEKGWSFIKPFFEVLHIYMKDKENQEKEDLKKIGVGFLSRLKEKSATILTCFVALTAVSWFQDAPKPQVPNAMVGFKYENNVTTPIFAHSQNPVHTIENYVGGADAFAICKRINEQVEKESGKSVVYQDPDYPDQYLFNPVLLKPISDLKYRDFLVDLKVATTELETIRIGSVLEVISKGNLLSRVNNEFVISTFLRSLEYDLYPRFKEIAESLGAAKMRLISKKKKYEIGPTYFETYLEPYLESYMEIVSKDEFSWRGWDYKKTTVKQNHIIDKSFVPKDLSMTFGNVTIEVEGHEMAVDYEWKLRDIIGRAVNAGESLEEIKRRITVYCENWFQSFYNYEGSEFDQPLFLARQQLFNALQEVEIRTAYTTDKTLKLWKFEDHATEGTLDVMKKYISSKDGTEIGISIQSQVDKIKLTREKIMEQLYLKATKDFFVKYTEWDHEKRSIKTNTSAVDDDFYFMTKAFQTCVFTKQMIEAESYSLWNGYAEPELRKMFGGGTAANFAIWFLLHPIGVNYLVHSEQMLKNSWTTLQGVMNLVPTGIGSFVNAFKYVITKNVGENVSGTRKMFEALVTSLLSMGTLTAYTFLMLELLNTVFYVAGFKRSSVWDEYSILKEEWRTAETNSIEEISVDKRPNIAYRALFKTVSALKFAGRVFVQSTMFFHENLAYVANIVYKTNLAFHTLLFLEAARLDIITSPIGFLFSGIKALSYASGGSAYLSDPGSDIYAADFLFTWGFTAYFILIPFYNNYVKGKGHVLRNWIKFGTPEDKSNAKLIILSEVTSVGRKMTTGETAMAMAFIDNLKPEFQELVKKYKEKIWDIEFQIKQAERSEEKNAVKKLVLLRKQKEAVEQTFLEYMIPMMSDPEKYVDLKTPTTLEEEQSFKKIREKVEKIEKIETFWRLDLIVKNYAEDAYSGVISLIAKYFSFGTELAMRSNSIEKLTESFTEMEWIKGYPDWFKNYSKWRGENTKRLETLPKEKETRRRVGKMKILMACLLGSIAFSAAHYTKLAPSAWQLTPVEGIRKIFELTAKYKASENVVKLVAPKSMWDAVRYLGFIDAHDSTLSKFDIARSTAGLHMFNLDFMRDFTDRQTHTEFIKIRRLFEGVDFSKWINFEEVENLLTVSSVDTELYNFLTEKGRLDVTKEITPIKKKNGFYLGNYFFIERMYQIPEGEKDDPLRYWMDWYHGTDKKQPKYYYVIQSLYRSDIVSKKIMAYDEKTKIVTDSDGMLFYLDGIRSLEEKKVKLAVDYNINQSF